MCYGRRLPRCLELGSALTTARMYASAATRRERGSITRMQLSARGGMHFLKLDS